MYRYASPADPGMLDRAVTLHRQALSNGIDRRSAVSLHADLGTLLMTRFERDGALADIDAAVAALQQALSGADTSDP
jgi:hypothetical protein